MPQQVLRVPETSSTSSDLYFIKTDFTGSGYVEIHSATAASDYKSGIDVATRFKDYDTYGQSFPPFGSWQMVGTTLYVIKTRSMAPCGDTFQRSHCGGRGLVDGRAGPVLHPNG
jgi:hypothetical protein